MSAAMTASEVHKQYTEIAAAFRKLIPDPALRLAFSRQVDGYVRQYALGVWQADSASSISPRHVEYYNAIWSLRAVLGGGLRGCQLRPVSAPRLL